MLKVKENEIKCVRFGYDALLFCLNTCSPNHYLGVPTSAARALINARGSSGSITIKN